MSPALAFVLWFLAMCAGLGCVALPVAVLLVAAWQRVFPPDVDEWKDWP